MEAQVVRLHSIRTLVVARDLAFRERAVSVLADLGLVCFAVAPLDEPDKIIALAAEQRAHVVVLDVTGCPGALAGAVTRLLEEAPAIGVVAVADRADAYARGLPVQAKWGWAADLRGAVLRAYHNGNPLKEETIDVSH